MVNQDLQRIPVAAGAGRASTTAAAVARAAVALAREHELERVTVVVVEQMLALGAVAVNLFLAEPGGDELRLAATHGIPGSVVSSLGQVALDAPLLAARVARTWELCTVEDVDRIDPTFTLAREIMIATGSRSMVCAPLVAFDKLVGVLTWTLREPPHTLRAETKAIRAIAEMFAVGIANAQARDGGLASPSGFGAAHAYLLREMANRHRLESALGDREAQLKAIFEHCGEFIGLLTPEGTLLEANSAALAFFGRERADVIGRPFWESGWWSDDAQRARLQAAIADAARGEHVRFEVVHTGADGRVIHIDFSLTPVRDAEGQVVLLVPEGHDITELKALEQLREEWSSMVAHDLRQPLNAIHLWTTVLERECKHPDDDFRQALEQIRGSNRHLDRMAADLLDSSRIAARRLSLRRSPVDLEAAVHAVLQSLGDGFGAHRFEVDAQAGVPTVEIDVQRFNQILGNLLSNAVKYGDGSCVRISLAPCDGGARVSVTNRGKGLDATQLAGLFRRFHRTEAARESSTPGVGLGLYIAKGLTEAHGGRLSVESEVGATTSFHVVLPAASGARG